MFTFTNLTSYSTFRHGGDYYYDCLEGRGSLSRGPGCKSLRAIRTNHIAVGTSDMSENRRPIIPAEAGTNANTPAQEALIGVVRDEWINLILKCSNAVQEHEIREGIDWLYKISGLLEHPRIVISDSYLEMVRIELGYYNLLARLDENPE
jgi:hypothetical protein